MYRSGLSVSVCCCFNCCSWAGVMVTRKCACVVPYVVQVLNLNTEELACRGWLSLSLSQPYKLIGCSSRLTNVLLPARMCATEPAQCILSADAMRKKLWVLNTSRWLGYYSSNLEILTVPFSFPQWGARQSFVVFFLVCLWCSWSGDHS